MAWRRALIGAGFSVLGATRLHRITAPVTQGSGVILTFHRVRSDHRRAFDPNGGLSITPEFLERTVRLLRRLGYAFVPLDEAVRRLASSLPPTGRFAVLTFDDGFRDNRDVALPVLERLDAPATFYVTPGFADRTARLWWVELEEAIRLADAVDVSVDGRRFAQATVTPAQKHRAFQDLYWHLREGSEERLLAVIGALAGQHHVESRSLAETLCLDWPGLEALARHPLVTIGAHTVSHPMLAKHDEARVRRELVEGRRLLEERLGQPVRHLAYPVGDATSADEREFRLAAEAGYASGVTTRPGLLFAGHRERLLSLPRVSVNGNFQSEAKLEILLSGLALALWNCGRVGAPRRVRAARLDRGPAAPSR